MSSTLSSMNSIPKSALDNLIKASRDPKLADFQYECLMEYIDDFEKSLNDNEELALKLACFGQTIILNVTAIGYHNPSIIQFCGYSDGNYCELIQHVSQLNFLLMSVPKSEPDQPARRIGFSPSDSNN